jgi:hypothetical protein
MQQLAKFPSHTSMAYDGERIKQHTRAVIFQQCGYDRPSAQIWFEYLDMASDFTLDPAGRRLFAHSGTSTNKKIGSGTAIVRARHEREQHGCRCVPRFL